MIFSVGTQEAINLFLLLAGIIIGSMIEKIKNDTRKHFSLGQEDGSTNSVVKSTRGLF